MVEADVVALEVVQDKKGRGDVDDLDRVWADVVAVAPTPHDAAGVTALADLVARLRHVGLTVSKREAVGDADHERLYLLVGATQRRLELQAESCALELPLKPAETTTAAAGTAASALAKGATVSVPVLPFRRTQRRIFAPATDDSLFTQTQRQDLVLGIVEGDADQGCAQLSLDALVKRGVLEKYFPLHDEAEVSALLRVWAGRPWRRQPVQRICRYFGESVGFYFAFLGFYSQWLAFASVPGVVAFAVHYAVPGENGWAYSAFSVVAALWAALYLEFWKRRQNVLVCKWHMENFLESERTRPDYEGEDSLGVWHRGTWVPLQEGEVYGVETPKPIKYAPKMKTRSRTLFTLFISAQFVAVVIIATIAILTFRLFMQKLDYGSGMEGTIGSTFGGVVGSLLNALVIQTLNQVYRRVAFYLTRFENHRTRVDFNRALSIKIFLFCFVNSYTALFYIAFFKRGTKLWGASELEDECFGDRSGIWAGCPNELTSQLASLLIFNLTVGQVIELVIPLLMGLIADFMSWRRSQVQEAKRHQGAEEGSASDAKKGCRCGFCHGLCTLIKMIFRYIGTARARIAARKGFPQHERERELSEYPGLIDEYSEMAVQFGYVTLFAAAFPLAPLVALANNFIEVRTDAGKFLKLYNKPFRECAKGIDVWYSIMQFTSILAIITNCLLIGFSYEPVLMIFRNSFTDDPSKQQYGVLWAVVILEHLVFLLKLGIAYFVSDIPKKVKLEIAKTSYIQSETLKRVLASEHPSRHQEVLGDPALDSNTLYQQEKSELFALCGIDPSK